MPELQIKDIPQELYNKLADSAEMNKRSLTQQAIILLEEALDVDLKKMNKKDALQRIRALQPYFKGVSIEDVVESIREDRDR